MAEQSPTQEIVDLSHQILEGREPGPEVLRAALQRLREDRGYANAKKKESSKPVMSDEDLDSLFS